MAMFQFTKKPLINFWQKVVQVPMRWYLLSVLVIAAIARLINLTKASIWHDEGFTMMIIQRDIIDIIARTANDVHPPLYYIVTHWWSLLFGDSEFAIRGLSALFGIGIVALVYFIVKRLKFSEGTARLATLFVAVGPFLVRYSQEARMYSMAALLVCAATLVFLIAIEVNKRQSLKKHLLWWLLYGAFAAAALYTHYYTIFIIPVHIGFAIWKLGGLKQVLKNKFWWLGNLTAAALFIPWLPALISQFTRVQSGFWIPPVDAETLPNTLMQFIAFDSNVVPSSIEMLLTLAFVGVVTALIFIVKKQRPGLLFILAWAFLPIILSILASLKQPIYYDRYFVYSSVAFYIILAVLIAGSKIHTWTKGVVIGLTLIISVLGITNVYDQAGHKMRLAGDYVNSHFKPGDAIVSGELYTYFDFDYYNHTSATVKLLSPNPVGKYGETTLIYDRQQDIVVSALDDIQRKDDQKRVWVVGKVGEHDYHKELIPDSWNEIDSFTAGDSAVRLYSL